MGENMNIGRFLGMVGALIWCPSNSRYLLLKRAASKDFASDRWECGTGRVDQGENFTQALRREVFEEIGVEVQVDFMIGTAHFYRGEKEAKNEMIGVFYGCTLNDPEKIQLSWEHSEFCWLTTKEVSEMFPDDFWLTRLISRSEAIRSMMPADLMEYQHIHGFEI